MHVCAWTNAHCAETQEAGYSCSPSGSPARPIGRNPRPEATIRSLSYLPLAAAGDRRTTDTLARVGMLARSRMMRCAVFSPMPSIFFKNWCYPDRMAVARCAARGATAMIRFAAQRSPQRAILGAYR